MTWKLGRFALTLIAFAPLLTLAACTSDETTGATTTTFIVTTTRQPADGGIISGGGAFSAGDTTRLTAVPAWGYAFSGWMGDIGGSTNPMVVTVDSDLAVTAVFRDILRVLVTLRGTGGMAEVPLATGVVSLHSSSPVRCPDGILASGVGSGGFLLSEGGSASEGLVANMDLASPPVVGTLVRDMLADDSSRAHSGVVRNGRLAVVDGNDGFFLWDWSSVDIWRTGGAVPEASGYWDVCANGSGSRFYVADHSAKSRGGIIAFDSAGAVFDTLFYADLGGAIPSTTAGPVALLLSSDAARLFVANSRSDAGSGAAPDDLLVFALDDPGNITGLLGRVPLVDQYDPSRVAKLGDSQGMELSTDQGSVFIAGDENSMLAVYHIGTGLVDVLELDPGASVPPHPTFLHVANKKVFLPGHDGDVQGNDLLYIVDETAIAVAATISLPSGSHPTGVTVQP
jgi:hypothetical protein